MMEQIRKRLTIIRSPKHKGAIFLKVIGSTRGDFLCKVYARKDANETAHVANQIIQAFSSNGRSD
jgi:hypothetical protein